MEENTPTLSFGFVHGFGESEILDFLNKISNKNYESD